MSDILKPVITPEQAAAILQDKGYRAKINTSGRFPFIESATSGLRFFVNFLYAKDDDPTKGYEDIQFDAGFTIEWDVNINRLLHVVNKFNLAYRFSKVSISSGEQPILMMKYDVHLSGEAVQSFDYHVGFFIHMIGFFVDEIVETDVYRGDGCTELHAQAIQFLYGCQHDPKAAIELYRLAAERGYAGSQNNLGDQYETAKNLPKSNEFAAYWYTRAAERGEPTAYLSLATLFSECAADNDMLLEAAKFVILAIAKLPQGFNLKTANECLECLKGRLTEDELQIARDRANDWLPLYQEKRLVQDIPSAIKKPNINIKYCIKPIQKNVMGQIIDTTRLINTNKAFIEAMRKFTKDRSRNFEIW